MYEDNYPRIPQHSRNLRADKGAFAERVSLDLDVFGDQAQNILDDNVGETASFLKIIVSCDEPRRSQKLLKTPKNPPKERRLGRQVGSGRTFLLHGLLGPAHPILCEFVLESPSGQSK